MLEPAMFLGLGLVAVWTYCRYPRLRPGSLALAIAHLAVSFGAFAVLPAAIGAFLPPLSSHASQLCVALTLLVLSLTYVLLSWVWLIARILGDLLGGTPRGGHPAANES